MIKNAALNFQSNNKKPQNSSMSLKETVGTSTFGSGRPSCEYNLVQNCMRDMGPNAAVCVEVG